MRFFGKLPSFSVSISLLLCSAACRKDSVSRGNDTLSVTPSLPDTTAGSIRIAPSWDPRAGILFAIPGPNAPSAYLVFPAYTSDVSLDSADFDLKSSAGTTLQLLRDGRQVGQGQIMALTLERADDCTAWPLAQLAPVASTSLPSGWTIAVDPKLVALPIDSLTGVSSRDSTRITVGLARLASALPGDTATAFRGRPFVVRHALPFSDGVGSLIFAEIVRSVSQEAMPLQEHLLVIAQVDTTERAGYRMQYFERTIGLEDTAETTELLAIVRADTSGLLAIISRDLGNGVKYSLIERLANGEWRLRWSSAYAGC